MGRLCIGRSGNGEGRESLRAPEEVPWLAFGVAERAGVLSLREGSRSAGFGGSDSAGDSGALFPAPSIFASVFAFEASWTSPSSASDDFLTSFLDDGRVNSAAVGRRSDISDTFSAPPTELGRNA